MSLGEYLPFWEKLSDAQRQVMERAATKRTAEKDSVLHNGSEDCVGLFLVLQGRLRAYILSDEGREITLYRLFERDLCLFSAACMMNSIEFDITVQAEKETEFYHIPTVTYQALMQESAAVANYTNAVMASRFSDVMWLLNQILYKRMDSRLAAFLLEESALEGSMELKKTHETIARHLGSAREVVTRLLKYLQEERLVRLSRGGVTLMDQEGLKRMAAGSIR